MAEFVAWRGVKSWAPFDRRSLAGVPQGGPVEEAPEDAPVEVDRFEAAPVSEARQGVIEAETLARARIDKAERERDEAHQQALAALRSSEATMVAEAQRLGQLADALVTLRASLLQEIRGHTVELIVGAAERIAGAALHLDPTPLLRMIEEAVGTLGPDLTVRISAEDEARVREALADRPIQVVVDPTVRAGCIANSPAGRIDASLDTAVQALRASAEPWARG